MIFAAATVIALAACGDDTTQPGSESENEPNIGLELVVSGLDQPMFLTSHPDIPNVLYVLERPGRIRVIRDGVLETASYLDISARVSTNGEGGLLSMAMLADFVTNGVFYVFYTDLSGATVVSRFRGSAAGPANPASEEIIFRVAQPFDNHNGGQIAFGPDGMLYIGLGDGGSGGDPLGSGQNTGTLLGSILRVDVNNQTPTTGYSIPSDNPFLGDPGGRDEIWHYGVRNPWRFSFDRVSGDLYIADVGQNRFEEVNVHRNGEAGGLNYGWNTREGSECFGGGQCSADGFTDPDFEYDHAAGCSITGGYVYRGGRVESLVGTYVYSDFCAGWVRGFSTVNGEVANDMELLPPGTVDSPSSFGEGPDGELYVLSIAGTVHRLVTR